MAATSLCLLSIAHQSQAPPDSALWNSLGNSQKYAAVRFQDLALVFPGKAAFSYHCLKQALISVSLAILFLSSAQLSSTRVLTFISRLILA